VDGEAPDVGDADYMLRWINAHESWGTLLAREVAATIARHEIAESKIVAFNELGIAPLLDLHALMGSWGRPGRG
jgi:hypothetical protein